MTKYDSIRIERLRELIRPAFDLKIMSPDNYHPLLTLKAQRESPRGIITMVIGIPESDFREEHCEEVIAHVFEQFYQNEMKEAETKATTR